MTNKTLKLAIFSALMLVGASMFFAPAKAQAFDPAQVIDPFCLFACDKTSSQPTVQNLSTVSNSYNSNSYNTTNTNTTPNTNTRTPGNNDGDHSRRGDSTIAYGYYGYRSGAPTYDYDPTPIIQYVPQPITYVQPTPVYNYYTTPSYNYNYPYSYSALGVSCSAYQTSSNVGDTITWTASAYGGNGIYSYSWFGTDGLYGYGSSISKVYDFPGTKTATVTVSSGGQSISQVCNNTPVVYNYNYNSYNYYPYNSYPITVSCVANVTFAPVGTNVTWTANVSGGNGYYSYNWSGTDNLYGTGAAVNTFYNSPGVKNATVYVQSGNQQTSVQCLNNVTVGVQNTYYNYNTGSNSINGAQIACFADATSARVGVPVTWAVEASGMGGNLTYAWTGSDGLSGNQSSIITTYVTSGLKSAVVTVTSSNGQSQSKACGNTVSVHSATASAPVKVIYQPPQQPAQPANQMSAASLFSLNNVPWGLVGILVIIILLVTVIYLLFNRKKM